MYCVEDVNVLGIYWHFTLTILVWIPLGLMAVTVSFGFEVVSNSAFVCLTKKQQNNLKQLTVNIVYYAAMG